MHVIVRKIINVKKSILIELSRGTGAAQRDLLSVQSAPIPAHLDSPLLLTFTFYFLPFTFYLVFTL